MSQFGEYCWLWLHSASNSTGCEPKTMTNSIFEFCDDVKHRNEDIVESTG